MSNFHLFSTCTFHGHNCTFSDPQIYMLKFNSQNEHIWKQILCDIMVAYRQNPNLIGVECFFIKKKVTPCENTPGRWLSPAGKLSLDTDFVYDLIGDIFISRTMKNPLSLFSPTQQYLLWQHEIMCMKFH